MAYQFTVPIRVQNKILRFQITKNDIPFVQIVQGFNHAGHIELGCALGEEISVGFARMKRTEVAFIYKQNCNAPEQILLLIMDFSEICWTLYLDKTDL